MNRARRLLAREPVRVYVYGLASALVALLVAYGLLEAGQAAVWLALVTALLAVPAAEAARARVSPVTSATPVPDTATHDVT